MKRFGGFFANESTFVDKQLLSVLCFIYLFSAQFTVEVKHLSDLQLNNGNNMKNFHKLLRHCNVLYSSNSYAQSVSKIYFASTIHYVYNFYYIYLHSVLLYQHY